MLLRLSFNKNAEVQGLWILNDIKPVKYPKITEKTTVEDIADAYMNSPATVGLAIATYDNGTIKTYTFGKKKINSNKKIDQDTLFEIGSITKTFTGALLQQLIKEGKINLNDPVEKYLPESYSMPKFKGSNKQITFKDMATHSSSLPRMPDDFNKYMKDAVNPYKDYQKKNIYNFLNNYELKRKIGSKYEYSNLAIGLLGNIIADMEKNSYEEVLRKRIFIPLKMKSSTISLNKSNNIASGHDINGNIISNWNFGGFEGAGAIKSSIADMAMYLKGNIETDGSNVTLSDNLYKPLYKIKENQSISFLWHINKANNRIIISHNGLTGGYLSMMKFDKKNKKGVVVLSNSTFYVVPVADNILEILYRKK